MIRLVAKENTDSRIHRQSGLEQTELAWLHWFVHCLARELSQVARIAPSDPRSKLDSEAISGWNKALETPFWALRADQTYLLASETKRSCKSLRVNSCFNLSHGTAYANEISHEPQQFETRCDLLTLLASLPRGTSDLPRGSKKMFRGLCWRPEMASYVINYYYFHLVLFCASSPGKQWIM